MRRVYLDYNATTPIHPDVAAAVGPFWEGLFGNPSSLHWAGTEVKGYYDGARAEVARLLKVDAEEVVFTSGGTEGDNQAVKGIAYSRRDKGNHIITTSVEHPGVLNACHYLESQGFTVTYMPVDGTGLVDPDDVRRAIRRETILISVMYANNETGTVLPLAEIGTIGREAGIPVHSDMVQALGKVDIDLGALPIDLASFSGHKVYAPKGIGVLFIRNGLTVDSLIHGGHQEDGRRAGTENVIGAVAFGRACSIGGAELEGERVRIESLRTRLLKGIMDRVEAAHLNGHPERRLPNTLNISFDYVESESLLLALDQDGIAISSGSACSSGSGEPSHVLLAMGIAPTRCQSAARISLGRGNTEEDVDYALSVIPDAVARLRAMSPFYRR
jgi:cysteine desulfurase